MKNRTLLALAGLSLTISGCSGDSFNSSPKSYYPRETVISSKSTLIESPHSQPSEQYSNYPPSTQYSK